MSITLLVPRYSHRPVSADERIARQIVNPLDPGDKLPQKCGDCGRAGSVRNPLMMRPVFRMDHGGPRGELYECKCSECMEKKAGRR